MIPVNLEDSKDILELKSKDVAKILGVKESTISGYKNGYDTIPLKNLVNYANYTKFTLDYLFGITQVKMTAMKIIIDNKIIGNNLKELRLKNNLTQEQLAQKLNIHQSTYSKYESGQNLIKTTYLYALTKIYKPFSIDKLFIKK